MLDYRLYFLDDADHIQGVVEFDCAGDAEAIAHAKTYADGRAMELWRRDRWIRRFPGKRRPARAARSALPR
jgi:hypothetical protein